VSVFTNPASRSKEQASAYTTAVLGLVHGQDPIGVLAATPSRIEEEIAGLTSDALRRAEAPGKWSIAAVIRHLADSEIVWGWRMRMALAHDRPPITGYDQDAWAERLGYMDADAGQALREFAILREMNLRTLRRCSSSDLDRVGVHAERGDESVAHMMKMYAGHDILHLNQIRRIKNSAR
jgi:hypothetical protein